MGKQPLALIVEDRPEVAWLWAKHLEQLNIPSVHASNLEEAFKQLARIPPPDLILLDLNLGPEETANYTVTQISKMREANPNVVIIVISGVITPELALLAIQQGALGVREKIELQSQVDLWNEIQNSLTNAPTEAKKLFSHTRELIEKLTKVMHFL